MRASYLLQLVNIISSAALLLIVLLFLDEQSYLQWVLFATIAGALIQAETSLSAIVVRHICRLHVASGTSGLASALLTASRLYKRFAIIGGLGVFILGGFYLVSADNGRFSLSWPIEWTIYCSAFVIYYSLANHASALVALEKLEIFSRIGIGLRLVNVSLAIIFLLAGLGVLGMALSVFVAFVLGAIVFRFFAARFIRREFGIESFTGAEPSPFSLHHVGLHALYILGVYLAYRFGLLFDATVTSDTTRQASYGFALQLFALLNVLAIVPLTMRIAPLVRTVESEDTAATLRELGKLGLLVNLVYVTGAGALVVGSSLFGSLLPASAATLPQPFALGLIAIAFWVEINITILVNGLLAAQDFRFFSVYFLSLITALATASALFLTDANFYVAFLLAPAVVQAVFALRLIFRMVSRRFEFGAEDYFRSMRLEARQLLKAAVSCVRAYR